MDKEMSRIESLGQWHRSADVVCRNAQQHTLVGKLRMGSVQRGVGVKFPIVSANCSFPFLHKRKKRKKTEEQQRKAMTTKKSEKLRKMKKTQKKDHDMQCFRGQHRGGCNLTSFFALLWTLLSCSKMSLLYFKLTPP